MASSLPAADIARRAPKGPPSLIEARNPAGGGPWKRDSASLCCCVSTGCAGLPHCGQVTAGIGPVTSLIAYLLWQYAAAWWTSPPRTGLPGYWCCDEAERPRSSARGLGYH